MTTLIALIDRAGGIDYTQQLAHAEARAAQAALAPVAPSAYRDALATLADVAVERDR